MKLTANNNEPLEVVAQTGCCIKNGTDGRVQENYTSRHCGGLLNGLDQHKQERPSTKLPAEQHEGVIDTTDCPQTPIDNERRAEASTFPDWAKHKSQITVKTCADVYNHWRTSKRIYKKRAPKDGIEFQIEYLDTGLAMSDAMRTRAPIVLALHGAPGSYEDFSLLIKHLWAQQVRVIAPNFPEISATIETNALFRHSADEKAAYLRDFLNAIDVSKIDLLVSHSSAIFPTLLILLNGNKDNGNAANERLTNTANHDEARANNTIYGLDELKLTLDHEVVDGADATTRADCGIDHLRAGQMKKNLKREARGRKKHRDQPGVVVFDRHIEIGALALLNPAGHRMPMSMKPCWMKCGSVQLYHNDILRYWTRKLGPTVLKIIGVPVKVDNMDNVILSATVMRNSKCRRLVSQLEQLAKLKLPTLLVFSENDKLIEKEIFYEMTQFMGLNPRHFDTYDSKGEIDRQQSNENDWIRVMVFKDGGHYAYSNYPEIVNQAISELLAKTNNPSKAINWQHPSRCSN